MKLFKKVVVASLAVLLALNLSACQKKVEPIVLKEVNAGIVLCSVPVDWEEIDAKNGLFYQDIEKKRWINLSKQMLSADKPGEVDFDRFLSMNATTATNYGNETRTDITVDGKKAVQVDYDHELSTKDNMPVRTRAIVVGFFNNVVEFEVTLPRETFEQEISRYDPILTSLKANANYPQDDTSGITAYTIWDLLDDLDSGLESGGRATLGRSKYTKEEINNTNLYSIDLSKGHCVMICADKIADEISDFCYLYNTKLSSPEDFYYVGYIPSRLYYVFEDDTHASYQIQAALETGEAKTTYETNHWIFEREEDGANVTFSIKKK